MMVFNMTVLKIAVSLILKAVSWMMFLGNFTTEY